MMNRTQLIVGIISLLFAALSLVFGFVNFVSLTNGMRVNSISAIALAVLGLLLLLNARQPDFGNE